MSSVIQLRRRPEADDAHDLVFRCGAAARWLPRVLGACWLVAGLLVYQRLDRALYLPFARGVQLTVVAAAVVLAVWTLRAGAETRLRLTLSRQRVLFAYGPEGSGSVSGVELADIDRFGYEIPLAASKQLFPATVVRDVAGNSWRIPAVLDGGDRAVREIVERAGRADLAAWADTLELERRMRRTKLVVAAGYVFAALIVAVAVGYWA